MAGADNFTPPRSKEISELLVSNSDSKSSTSFNTVPPINFFLVELKNDTHVVITTPA